MQIIDLSNYLEDVIHDRDPKIEYISHKKGGNLLGLLSLLDTSIFKFLRNIFLFVIGNKRITYKDFPNEEGLALEKIISDTHAGTHLDAPFHFASSVNGQSSKTIDRIPLEWCISDGVALDVSNINGNVINTEDIISYLHKINYEVKPLDIILFHTGASKKWNTKEYPNAHKSISPDLIKYLSHKGVKIIVCDAYTIDKPFQVMFNEYHNTKRKEVLWESHKISAIFEVLHVENAANIDLLLDDPTGYIISCLPVKIKNGSAGWVRLIAIKKNNYVKTK
jgi:kynurenine formamidase